MHRRWPPGDSVLYRESAQGTRNEASSTVIYCRFNSFQEEAAEPEHQAEGATGGRPSNMNTEEE